MHKKGLNDLHIFNVTEKDAGIYICQINTEPMKNLVQIILKWSTLISDPHFSSIGFPADGDEIAKDR